MNQRLIVEGNDGWALTQLCASNKLPIPEGFSKETIGKFVTSADGYDNVQKVFGRYIIGRATVFKLDEEHLSVGVMMRHLLLAPTKLLLRCYWLQTVKPSRLFPLTSAAHKN